MSILLCYYVGMQNKITTRPFTKEQIEKAKRQYEEAILSRNESIRVMREDLGWTFQAIGAHFGITKQAVEQIYKSLKS